MDLIAAARDGISVSEIARALGLPTPTALRIVGNLVDIGYANGGGRRSRYTLGRRFHRQVQFSQGTATLDSIAAPVLEKLAASFHQTTFMTRLIGRTVGLAAAVFPNNTAHTLIHPGEQFPFHATSAGKVYCAYQGTAFVDEVLRRLLEAIRPNTITDADALRRHFADVKVLGYATIDDELDEGVYAVSCPVHAGETGVLYTIGVVGLRDRLLSEHALDAIVDKLRPAAAMLSTLIAIPPPPTTS